MNTDYRLDELKLALNAMRIPYLDILVTGNTGAGKSSTINAILGYEGAKVGEGVSPETNDVIMYRASNKLHFWDSPGFGDGVENDKRHAQKITALLRKGERFGYIDLVLLIIDGSNRDMGTVYRLLTDVIIPNFPRERVLFGINQADMAMKGRHWNDDNNTPDAELEKFLHDKAASVKRRIREATGLKITEPVCFSGKYSYNVSRLLDLIFDNLPTKRRYLQKWGGR